LLLLSQTNLASSIRKPISPQSTCLFHALLSAQKALKNWERNCVQRILKPHEDAVAAILPQE
jgi:hypothetical protein